MYTVNGTGGACSMRIKTAPLKADPNFSEVSPPNPPTFNWGVFPFPYQGSVTIPEYFPLGQYSVWAEPEPMRPNPCKGKTTLAYYEIKPGVAQETPAQGSTGAGQGAVASASPSGGVAQVGAPQLPQLQKAKITALKVVDTTIGSDGMLKLRLEGSSGRTCEALLYVQSVDHPEWKMMMTGAKVDTLPAEVTIVARREGSTVAAPGKYQVRVTKGGAGSAGCDTETPFVPYSVEGPTTLMVVTDVADKLKDKNTGQVQEAGGGVTVLPAQLKEVKALAKWYDKYSNTWEVLLNGTPGKACALKLELTHAETGQTRAFYGELLGGASLTMNNHWGPMTDPMPAGHYKVVAKATTASGPDRPPCRLTNSPSANIAFFDLAPADTANNVYLTLDSAVVDPPKVYAGGTEPVSFDVNLKSDPNSKGESCVATLEVREFATNKTFTKPVTIKRYGSSNRFDVRAMVPTGFKKGQYGINIKAAPNSGAGAVPACLGNVGNMLTATDDGALIDGFAWVAGPAADMGYDVPTYTLLVTPKIKGKLACSYRVGFAGQDIPGGEKHQTLVYAPGAAANAQATVFHKHAQTDVKVTISGAAPTPCFGFTEQTINIKPTAMGASN